MEEMIKDSRFNSGNHQIFLDNIIIIVNQCLQTASPARLDFSIVGASRLLKLI